MILNDQVFSVPATQVSLLKNIPMPLLEQTKARLKKQGVRYTIRYRGPRATAPNDTRSARAKQSDCLKENANRFTVYWQTV
jgi:hypothetical protein